MEGNASRISLQASSRRAFRERYIRRFLPLLSCLRVKSTTKRYKAVKRAADLSLACTAGWTGWSKALCKSLLVQTTRKQRTCLGCKENEAGKRLRRRRIRSRVEFLSHRKSYLRGAQRKHRPPTLQAATERGKLESASMASQYGIFEAAQLSSLSNLIPGGHHMDTPKLLDQTAHYIISLQLQVDALSFLGRTLSAQNHL